MTVKRIFLAAALSSAIGLLSAGAVRAAVIDLDATNVLHQYRVADAVAPPSPSMSELPEPEVFAMMLVGLILIGYRASRDSSEKFKKD